MAKKFELTIIKLSTGKYMTMDRKFFVYGYGDTVSDSIASYKNNFIITLGGIEQTIELEKRNLAKMEKHLKKWKF